MNVRNPISLLCGLLTIGIVVPNSYAVNCSQLVNPVYVSGSSALEPLYKAIGPTLATDKTMPLTIVYQKPGSCPGISGLTVKQTANPLYIDATFDGINVPTCTNDIAGGFPLDVALSDVSYENCVGSPIPAAYKDYLGPVESMVFAVPRASSQTAITAEEAYYLFGFGMFGNVAPWDDESLMCIRSSGSGTQRLLAATIKLPAQYWLGKGSAGSTDVLNCLGSGATKNPEKSIGILGTEVLAAGSARTTLKALALRGPQQYRAYYPDSTIDALDKRNVRDGHYMAFGFSHMITAVNGSGVPLSARAATFIDLVRGYPMPRIDILNAIVKVAKLVPACAMKVTRTTDGGDISLQTPAAPCGCYFESTATSTTPANCMTCSTDSQCSPGHCRLGYCEVQ